MTLSLCVNFHPFAPALQQWETGVPMDCGPDWAWETIETAVLHGTHKSAMTPESVALIAEDVAYQVKAGYTHYFMERAPKASPQKLKGIITCSGTPTEPQGTHDS
jgi:hypothetical protein